MCLETMENVQFLTNMKKVFGNKNKNNFKGLNTHNTYKIFFDK